MPFAREIHRRQRGAVLVLSMIFILLFSALAAAMVSFAGANVQLASNQHRVNTALYAAQSGLECAAYLVTTVALPETGINYVTASQADAVWSNLCAHVQDTRLDGKSVPAACRFCDALGAGDEIVTPALNYGDANGRFTLRFYRYDDAPLVINVQSVGADGTASRCVTMEMAVTKDREVLGYAIASRGRMWLTGDTTIHGNLLSTWNRAEISPYNMTADSTVLGTINTVLTLDQIEGQSYDLETLNADDLPMDVNGAPLGTNYEDRYYGPNDEVKAYHEGIHYGRSCNDMPGMDISDYNTDDYVTGLAAIPAAPASNRITEYFPHATGEMQCPKCAVQDRPASNVKHPSI